MVAIQVAGFGIGMTLENREIGTIILIGTGCIGLYQIPYSVTAKLSETKKLEVTS